MIKIKVLFHIDEDKKWNMVLNNVKNLIKEVEDRDIIVIANADTVKGYERDSETYEDMKSLSEKSVKFKACNNSLEGNNIDKDSIGEFVEIVPSGVVEIAKRQMEGYAYIKP